MIVPGESESFVEKETGMTSIARELTVEIALHAPTDPALVDLDAHLVVDLGLSSLDVLSVLAFAETTFDIVFADGELGGLTTVRSIERAVRAQRSQKEHV